MYENPMGSADTSVSNTANELLQVPPSMMLPRKSPPPPEVR